MSEQYEHIMKIRKEEYFTEDQEDVREKSKRTFKKLQRTIEELATNLYRKDSHFLMELIQNAEDNEYDTNNPSLRFILLKIDPTGTPNSDGALIVKNNERGFTEINMSAMCDIAGSSKKKREGYIGEKGIGFKSVFKVTKKPFIFSNNYQVSFPDKINDLGLGYIVPIWVNDVPEIVDMNETTIILPLNTGKFGFSEIRSMLREFSPETVLFLKKLRELNISIEHDYDISIKKQCEGETLAIIDTCENTKEGSSFIREKYLTYAKVYQRPEDLVVDKREDIYEREITISFPVSNSKTCGALYAYLPILENTGMPFIVNADFLVPGSRDTIYEDNPWNKWLRDRLPELFVEAFSEFMKLEEYKIWIFQFIPTKCKVSFLEPIVQSILTLLSGMEIIPTLPNEKLVVPSKAIISNGFRSVLSSMSIPAALHDRLMIIDIQESISKEVAAALKISSLKLKDLYMCLVDMDWLVSIGLTSLVSVFKYLSQYDVTRMEALKTLRIIPVDEDNTIVFCSTNEQQIYFQVTKTDSVSLNKIPKCASKNIRFIASDFQVKIDNEDKLKAWMKNSLFVRNFSPENYAESLLKWLSSNYSSLKIREIVDITEFILKYKNKELKLDDLPVIMNNSKCLPLSELLKGKTDNQFIHNGIIYQPRWKKKLPLAVCKEIVTPMGLDPDYGWQHLFISKKDRCQLYILSDAYISKTHKSAKIFEILKATRAPYMLKTILKNATLYSLYSENITEKESKELLSISQLSAKGKRDDIYMIRSCLPSGIHNTMSHDTRIALVKWLNYQSFQRKDELASSINTSIVYYFHGETTSEIESEVTDFLKNDNWLPTNLGLRKPTDVFLHTDEIYEMMGDSVPYLTYELSMEVINFLGIKDRLTINDLINILIENSLNNTGSIEMAERIYCQLNSRDMKPEYKRRLVESECVAIQNGKFIKWVSPSICIWNDRSDLFRDEFFYLELLYPRLQNFFVDVLEVENDISDKHYTELWLKLQKNNALHNSEVESKLSLVYRKIEPLFDSSNLNENWWISFLTKALLWSHRKQFVRPSSMFIPDDGNLKDIFDLENVHYLWYPMKSSHSQWHTLHRAFNVKSLKESVSITLKDMDERFPVNPAKYLTKSAKTLILLWLREKQIERFNSLIENKKASALINTDEYRSDKLIMNYVLDGIQVESSSDSYLHIADKKLFYCSTACKSSISAEICRVLTDNENDEVLESWIMAILGASETDLTVELKKKNWQVRDEILQLFSYHHDYKDNTEDDSSEDMHEAQRDNNSDVDALDDELNQENDNNVDLVNEGNNQKSVDSKQEHGHSSDKDQKQRRRKNGDPNEKPNTNIAKEVDYIDDDTYKKSIEVDLLSVFNTVDQPIKDIDYRNDDTGYSHDPTVRYEKESDRVSYKINNSRAQTDRYKEVRRRILDGPDPAVRETLSRWYSGKCQICDSTFIQKNGKPFFISHFLVSRKFSDSADMIGNSICLCADHFAKMVYGRLKSLGIIEQIEGIDPNNDNFELYIRVNDDELSIKYNQKHAIALKAFYETNKVDSDELL